MKTDTKTYSRIKAFCAQQKAVDAKKIAAKFGIEEADEMKEIIARLRAEGGCLDYNRAQPHGFLEKNYQSFILKFLVQKQGWVERKNADFDPVTALDRELVLKFIKTTQPDAYYFIYKFYKGRTDKVLLDALDVKLRGDGLIPVLKNGFDVDNEHFFVMAPKPDAPYNKKAWEAYKANIFSVAKEVEASKKERIDLVLFLNGIAIVAIELKDNNAGQNFHDAQEQWKDKRSPKTRLFFPKGGVFVMFAADLDEVYMTTQLNGRETRFLPFNKGLNSGHDDIDCGAGNPPAPQGKYKVHYLWEETFAKDRLLEIITRYVFIEKSEYVDEAGKKHFTESVIFPRYHQLDVVTKLIDDVSQNHTKRNYLIQHSAGSGKTNSISWLAYRLASLFSGGQKPGDPKNFLFDHVIVMTDRRVVIRQLQAAVKQLENSPGYLKCISDDDPSSDLADAFKLNKKIIATTIQRFAYIQDLVFRMQGKNFAVIIDEAHSSTKGKSMIAVKKVLGADFDENDTPEELMHKLMAKQAKQKNVSMFAFTATPRAETIQLFGQHTGTSRKGVFHTYSMKQAIEEGFILDVLRNYTEYKTFYEVVKKIEDDPVYKLKQAKSLIAQFALSSPETVAQRSVIMLEHFLENYPGKLGGNAKAMVVTSSRQEAVAYWDKLRELIAERGLSGSVNVLVAFSGPLTYKGKKVSEHDLNGFSEDALPKEFCKAKNRILVVADKYQTGFDQRFLSFMYVAKKLRDIAAVQTLSRLNRTCPPYDNKTTYVLDFANTADDIARSFSMYYRSTMLNNAASSGQLLEAAARIDQFDIFDDDACNDFWEAICRDDEPAADKVLFKAEGRFRKLAESDQDECRTWMNKLCSLYPFVAQAVNLSDTDLFKKDQFCQQLLRRLKGETPTPPKLFDKIAVKRVKVVKGETSNKTPGESEGTKLPDRKPKPKDIDPEERLSEIIREINEENSTDFDSSIQAKGLMQIRERMIADRRINAIASERSNSLKDFTGELEKRGEQFVSDAYTDNNVFFKFLLDHEDVMKKVIRAMAKDVRATILKGK